MNYVYLLRCEDVYKIGVAHNVADRINQLQTGNSNKIIESYSVPIGDMAYHVERKLHKLYEHCKVKGEWFRLTDSDVTVITKLLMIEAQAVSKVSSIDKELFMFTLGMKLNSAEANIVKFLLESYKLKEMVSGIVIEPSKCSTYSKYIAKAFEKNYKHLRELQVLVRVQRGKYVVNPLVVGITMPRLLQYFDTCLQN